MEERAEALVNKDLGGCSRQGAEDGDRDPQMGAAELAL